MSLLRMPPAVRHNARQLYGDIFSFGLLAGSTAAFLPVYITRLGGNSFQLALISAAPAVMNLLLSLPSIGWLRGRSLLRVTFDLIIFNRLTYLPFMFLPWLVSPGVEIWILVTMTALAMVPGTVINVSFNAMFADMIPPEFRAEVVGTRNALIGLSMLAASLLCGWLLDALPFPINYQVVWAVGLVGLAGSTFFLGRLRDSQGQTPHRPQALADLPRAALARLAALLKTIRQALTLPAGKPTDALRIDLLRGPFGLFLLAYFLFYTFQSVPVPLYPLFWVNDLSLSDGLISIGNALFNLVVLGGSATLAMVANRVGHRRLLVIGVVLYGLQPLLSAFTYNVPMYIVTSLIGGIGWGLAGGTLATRLMERVPENDRPAHMGLYNLAMYLGVLAGSFAGPLVGDWLGVRDGLLASGVLRIMVAVLLLLWA